MHKMIINRYNYQEYFLLYTDNELEPEARLAVESFAQQHPDLEEELIMLQQSVFKPDEQVVFENKESLLQFNIKESVINAENFNEFAIGYSDNELNNQEKAELEDFIRNNPHYQQEFNLIQDIKFSTDESITFPGKEMLYRYEKNARSLIFPWWRMAAAAVILFFAGLLWFNKRPADKHLPNIAQEIKPASSKHPGNLMAKQQTSNLNADDKKESHPEDNIAPSTTQTSRNVVIAGREIKGKMRMNKSRFSAKTAATYENHLNRQDQNEFQNNTAFHLPDNEIPKPVHFDKNILPKTNAEIDNIAFIDASIEKNNKRIKEQPVLNINTVNNENYLAKTVANTVEEDEGSLLTDKKSPLRGILRKASRFIDKNTSSRNPKKSGLLIGNIQIAFQ